MLLKSLYNFSKSSNFFWSEINAGVQQAQYAVRGLVPTLAGQIQSEIQNGSKKYPFDQVTFCNIGNPQAFRQKPLSFNRQVLSCLVNPRLIGNPEINSDASDRAKNLLSKIVSMGSYTHSLGIPYVRQSIAKFIAKEDNVPEPSIEHIFTTEGASQGVHLLLSTMINSKKDAIMIPIPQYPLYSAAISLYQGSPAPYFFNESKGWQLDFEELDRAYEQSKKNGCNIKSIVIINPGNPTGSILSTETIKQVIEFSVKRKIVIIADEVYRENIYKQNTKFQSFRKVLETMSDDIKNSCELASLHSISKGLLGECGMRGGYLYLHNFNPTVMDQLVKLKSINLCSNSIGQSMVELMVNPPTAQNSKPQTVTDFQDQYNVLFKSLKSRANLVTKALRQMKNIETQEVEGAMYAFPSIKFSKAAIKAAGDQSADLFYCLEVLKNTGIALVPGSGFRQEPGTYHFRITTLILPEEKLNKKLEDLKKFNEAFHKKYQD